MAEIFQGRPLTEGEKNLIQNLAIVIDSDRNPLVPFHNSAGRNYRLRTRSQNVNQAINELLRSLSASDGLIENFIKRFEKIIGDEYNEEAEHWNNIHERQGNVLRAIEFYRRAIEEQDDKILGIALDTMETTHLPDSSYFGMKAKEYSDMAPGAWTGSKIKFDEIDETNPRNNGTYFVYSK